MGGNASNKNDAAKRKEFRVTVILLFLFWMIISIPADPFSARGINDLIQHTVIGLLLAVGIAKLVKFPILTSDEITDHRLPNLIKLFAYVIYLISQILLAGIDVARRVMRSKIDISPGIIKFDTPLTDDLQITLNANSITLTPGTITIDAIKKKDGGSTFWVHCISQDGVKDMMDNKGFVEKIQNIYRKGAA